MRRTKVSGDLQRYLFKVTHVVRGTRINNHIHHLNIYIRFFQSVRDVHDVFSMLMLHFATFVYLGPNKMLMSNTYLTLPRAWLPSVFIK